MTPYHSKYYAAELTKRYSAADKDKLNVAVAGAQVDLNPHQVEAALFAFRSPLSKGVLLADEVGLGKTIEAGLIISQKWAERRRRVLVITPANLRKQWHQELSEKFFLPCRILETRSYNQAVKAGQDAPFEADEVVICSYQFARSKESDVRSLMWDLVVIDEAHRLRNVYKPSNIVANALRNALEGCSHKVLLTATPLQNSLLELYGLVSFIDDKAFGDLASFREQYTSLSQQHAFDSLKNRLKPLCHRTLRRQVMAYVSYTKRFPLLQEFSPHESEDKLYDMVTEYLQRENLQALPSGQRNLITLVLRKLLASSSFAIAGALSSISERLRGKLREESVERPVGEELGADYEALEPTADEWVEATPGDSPIPDRAAIEQEIADLEEFIGLAGSITSNAKGEALLKALDTAFAKATEIGAARKAIIFTESRRTQDYLLRLLAESEFSEGIVLFNGSNTDERSKEIYASWVRRHAGSDRVTGSRTADMRSALVEYFRDEGQIMIATEAGAEGINLQFCSLVVNYDLPWNPQRVEQRIGRCHRYGQKHDVVVVNFLNQRNEADQRVYQLLDEKFELFKGVFGASDEVLGAIENGVDFERRIADIYQNCRQPAEIKKAFDKLQLELSFEIDEAMTNTRRQLLENFDEQVTEKLRLRETDAKASLNQFERRLMALTRHELNGHAAFEGDERFLLKESPFPDANGAIPTGWYGLPRHAEEEHVYRSGHPLAERLIDQALQRELPPARITFDLTGYASRISALEPYIGRSGWLQLSRLTVESMGQAEDHLLCAALDDDGRPLHDEDALRLFSLDGMVEEFSGARPGEELEAMIRLRSERIQHEIAQRNSRFFDEETNKIDNWADDLKVGLEREIKEIDRQIREARRVATAALTLEEKLAGQKQVRALEAQRSQKRRSLFDAQDEVDAKRQELIDSIEVALNQISRSHTLFVAQWELP